MASDANGSPRRIESTWTRTARRGVVTLACLAIVVAGCSADDGPSEGASSAAADEVPDTTTAATGPSTAPAGSTAATDPAASPPGTSRDDAGSPAGFERAVLEGITFLYPARRWTDVGLQPDTGEPALTVTLLAGTAGGAAGRIEIRTVRVPGGEFHPATSPGDRELVDRLESGSVDGESLDFVNGSGIRHVAQDRYVFEGLTSSGDHLVEVEVPLSSADDRSVLDEIDTSVRSIFVDGAATVLRNDCEPGVELLSEVDVVPGRVVSPGTVVTASWTTRNTGTCAWTDTDGWVFGGGDPVTLLDGDDPGGVGPGEEHVVEVSFEAPAEPGRYSAQWQFQVDGSLEPLGPIQAISIEVVAN